MRRGIGTLLAGTPAVSVWAGDAVAQTRTGIWLGAGGGIGAAQACKRDGCGERYESGVGYFEAGGTLNEQWLVGGEFAFWSKKYAYPKYAYRTPGDYSRVTMYHLTGTVTFYPVRGNGLFVKGGAGVAMIDSSARVSDVTFDAELGKGLGFVVGGRA
jgi:hypothetical protein